jgi:hypothetical protein
MNLQLLFSILCSALTIGCAPSNVGIRNRSEPEIASPSSIGGTATVEGTDTTAQVSLDAELVSHFKRRIDRYMQLHDKLQRQGTPPRQTTNTTENEVSRDELATRIRAARHDARQGDIFTPAIAAALRRAMNPELRGVGAAGTRESIREDAPAKFTLQVNGSYPEGASRSTMPGNVLKILPPLPKGIEYRIVDTHLILMDLDADIVVDYLFDVMCAVC